jgi:hypothetical protein
MHGIVTRAENEATKATDQTDSDGINRWFADACDCLIEKNPGLYLELQTGFQERSCARYAAGTRAVHPDIPRALYRSDDGEQWLRATMAGCQAKWWQRVNLALKILDAIEKHKGERV